MQARAMLSKAAEKLGYPVTLKVSSAAIAHKTEAGGVALNLKTADEVRAAAARMAKLADEVLVERMVDGRASPSSSSASNPIRNSAWRWSSAPAAS